MALHLRIENLPNLPDGGPVEITVTGRRGIDIGRDTHLDWTLPDPTRFISGKHAEIRFKDGGYWLHDVSTNGTYLNGGDHRMQRPHRLRTGDRFTIGHYIVATAVDEDQETRPAGEPSAVMPPPVGQDMWSMPGEAPPPIDPRELRAARERSPVRPDFLDWAADVPHPLDETIARASSQAAARHDPAEPHREEMDWARASPPLRPTPPPAPPIPAPRRPAAGTPEPTPEWSPAPSPFEREPRDVPPPPSPAAQEPPPPRRAAAPAAIGDVDAFIRALARAAGVPDDIFLQKDPQELAEQLGGTLRIVVENLSQLLHARVQAKRLVRSAVHTVVQATDNNPLKFSPSPEEALRMMFGPPSRGYLDAHQALRLAFEDIKTHQVKTYSALQHALNELMADLDPQTIEREAAAERGISAVVGSRKAKLWDAYVARWQAKQRVGGGGLLDAFMLIFAKYYDEQRR